MHYGEFIVFVIGKSNRVSLYQKKLFLQCLIGQVDFLDSGKINRSDIITVELKDNAKHYFSGNDLCAVSVKLKMYFDKCNNSWVASDFNFQEKSVGCL